jgi:hypothetical protein
LAIELMASIAIGTRLLISRMKSFRRWMAPGPGWLFAPFTGLLIASTIFSTWRSGEGGSG